MGRPYNLTGAKKKNALSGILFIFHFPSDRI